VAAVQAPLVTHPPSFLVVHVDKYYVHPKSVVTVLNALIHVLSTHPVPFQKHSFVLSLLK
jgi:hypothetical protein